MDPGYFWGDEGSASPRPRRVKRPVPAPAWPATPFRARTPPPPLEPNEPAGDGDVPIHGKPLPDPPEAATPVGTESVGKPFRPPAADEPEREDPIEERGARLREAAAELAATKERIQREAERERLQQRSELVKDLLPVLDNLDRSLEASTNTPDQSLREGVRMVRDQFEQVLRNFGVEVIDAKGLAFDPSEHEALAMVPVDNSERHRSVVKVLRPGYRHDGRLLRAAQVAVGDYRETREEAAAG